MEYIADLFFGFVYLLGAMVVSNTCNTDSSRPYNDNEYGVLASSTSSIYGVYDMAGGSWEIVMAVMKSEDGSNIISGRNDNKNSGYTGILFDKDRNISKTFSGKSLPDAKYYDVYNYNINIDSVDKSHLGDATGETVGWYGDFRNFLDNPKSWLMRGGLYNHEGLDGVFAYGGVDGRASILRSFRTVIVNIK